MGSLNNQPDQNISLILVLINGGLELVEISECLFSLCSTVSLHVCNTECFFLSSSVHEVFSRNHAAPFSKVLTFLRRGPFELEAFYSDPQGVPYPEAKIGEPLILCVYAFKDLVYKCKNFS